MVIVLVCVLSKFAREFCKPHARHPAFRWALAHVAAVAIIREIALSMMTMLVDG